MQSIKFKSLTLAFLVLTGLAAFTGCSKKKSSLATVSTAGLSSITDSSAVCGGEISSDGGATITARGVCWSTSANPTVGLTTKTTDGTGTGSYTSNITGLSEGVTYYLRAYATNSAGTAYGNEVTFAASSVYLPSLSTSGLSIINDSTATCVTEISYSGGSTVTARGVCWSTSANPTVALTKTIDGADTGSYTSAITGLKVFTNYYMRAYATNSVGTAYGNEQTILILLPIGANYGGGKVAYILQPGDPGYDPTVPHGLIAAPGDQSTGLQWYNGSNITTGATGTAIGNGKSNTDSIVKAQGVGSYAAYLCDTLTIDGFTDWYLPSQDELNLLYINQAAIGGFSGDHYWSSSEFSSSGAWIEGFITGGQADYAKDNTLYVRAVRAF